MHVFPQEYWSRFKIKIKTSYLLPGSSVESMWTPGRHEFVAYSTAVWVTLTQLATMSLRGQQTPTVCVQTSECVCLTSSKHGHCLMFSQPRSGDHRL